MKTSQFLALGALALGALWLFGKKQEEGFFGGGGATETPNVFRILSGGKVRPERIIERYSETPYELDEKGNLKSIYAQPAYSLREQFQKTVSSGGYKFAGFEKGSVGYIGGERYPVSNIPVFSKQTSSGEIKISQFSLPQSFFGENPPAFTEQRVFVSQSGKTYSQSQLTPYQQQVLKVMGEKALVKILR